MVLTEAEEAFLLDLLRQAEPPDVPQYCSTRDELCPFRPFQVLSAVQSAGGIYWRAFNREKRAFKGSLAQRRARLLKLAKIAADNKKSVTEIKKDEVYRLLGVLREGGKIDEIERMHEDEVNRAELKAFLESCAAALDGVIPEHQTHLDEARDEFVRALRRAVADYTHIETLQPNEALEGAADELRWGPFRRFAEAALRIVDPGLPAGTNLLMAVRRSGQVAFEPHWNSDSPPRAGDKPRRRFAKASD